MLRRLLTDGYKFFGGYRSTSPKLAGEVNTMADGSENAYITGAGKVEVFKGVTYRATELGSQVMMNADNAYAGLGDENETGIGSVFRVLAAVFFIGAGKLYWNGTYLSDSATTTLSLKTVSSGTFSATYQAGLAEPSAPTISAVAPPSGFSGKNNGTISAKIARFRTKTGAVSNASLSSNIVTATNQSIAVTFPSADSNGQDYWKIYGTRNGFGGVGDSYFYADIAESTITAAVTATATTDADTTIGVPNGTLDATHVGWQYTSAGDTTTYITDVGAADSHSAGKQTITLAAASVLTTSQSATFTRAVAGVTRTYVFEWRDADLTSEFAPIRNYPPPAGNFAGAAQDVVFVDGCYGDGANVATQSDDQTTTYDSDLAGNAIAISDPVKPESFPPDNYIFTGDRPTCLLEGGDGVFWRFGRNSMGMIRYVGGQPALYYDRVWQGIGVANQNNAVLGQGGRLYAFTGQRSLVRLGLQGEPDTLFAAPIMDDIGSWTDAVMGRDGQYNVVCVMNGLTIHAFYEPLGVWCAPLKLDPYFDPEDDATIRAAVTVADKMYLAVGDAASIRLYDFNIGSGSTAKVRTAWIPAADVSTVISRVSAVLRSDNTTSNSVAVRVYCNGDDGTVRRSFTFTPTAGQVAQDFFHLPVLKPNVRQAKSYRIELELTSSGGSAGFERIDLMGEDSGITF